MVTLVAMEKPCNVGGEIRDAKVAVLKAMLDADPEEAPFPIGCGMSLWICLVVYAKVLFASVCVQIQSALPGAHLHLFIEH